MIGLHTFTKGGKYLKGLAEPEYPDVLYKKDEKQKMLIETEKRLTKF